MYWYRMGESQWSLRFNLENYTLKRESAIGNERLGVFFYFAKLGIANRE